MQRDSSPPPARAADALWVLALLGLLLLPALLRAGLLMDDRELIFDNPAVNGALPWWKAFGRDYFHHLGDAGQWRPLATLSLRLDHLLFGTRVTAYHLSNGALQLAVVAGLALALVRGAAGRGLSRASLLGACALFALHPALCDSFLWIAGRTSMLSALGPLFGGLLAQAWLARGAPAWRVGAAAGIGLLLGMLAKEDAAVFAPALLALAWPHGRRARLGVAAGLLAAVGIAFVGRWLALGGAFVGAATPVLEGAGLGERLRMGGLAWWEALRTACWPLDLPPRYSPELLERRAAWIGADLAALLGALAWGLFWVPLTRAFAGRDAAPPGPLAWASALVALSFLPVAQLVPLGEVFAGRFLYLPLLFAAPLVAAGLERLRPARLRAATVLLLVLALAAATYSRATVYADRGAWRLEQLRHDPRDAASWNNLGLFREEQGQLDQALAAWRRATECDPSYSRAWSNLGRLRFERGELEDAERAWRRAVREGPSNPVAHVNLGSLLLRRGALDEATASYQRAARLAPGLAPAWLGLALAHSRAGRGEAALRAVRRALELDPKSPAARRLAASLGLDDGR